MSKILIHSGQIVDGSGKESYSADILIENGNIRQIGKNLPQDACQCIDASSLIVAPGLVDTHVHFREPGGTHKEEIATGAQAAAKGGFTTVVCMANTTPPVDNIDILQENLAKGHRTGINVLQAACITQYMKGEVLTDMDTLAGAGAACFTDDGLPIQSAALTREAMLMAKALGKVLSFHEEDASLLAGSGVNEGEISRKLGVSGASTVAEDVLVARDCMLALHTGARVVIQHISSAIAVELVRTAKKLGADIHAEATPQHFSLTEDIVLERGTLAKVNPPLRTHSDRQAVLDGLRDGTIDIIATDHAPHAADEKTRPFTQAPSGMIGLETSLALGITNLVQKGVLTLPQLIQKMASNPAQCYSLNVGIIQDGAPADLVLFSLNERWTVDQFVSRSQNSPFIGQELTGRVHCTICGGKTVYSL